MCIRDSLDIQRARLIAGALDLQAGEHADRHAKRVNGAGELGIEGVAAHCRFCLLYTSPSPRDRTRSRMPSSSLKKKNKKQTKKQTTTTM